jgi:hypothetical protein
MKGTTNEASSRPTYRFKRRAGGLTSMSKSHNKKRNTGLLYEFLVQTISRALVEGDQKKSATALKIIKKHFKPGTQLYKEYRLIYSLVKTTVSSEHVAGSILQEAKAAARSYDFKELDREKSLLISHINKAISDDDFYDQQVNEYKIYATIQTLINDWRTVDRDLSRLAQYEDQLVKWLITEKAEMPDATFSDESPGTSRLLMKVMMRKLNEKYAAALSDEQKGLIRAYAFSTANDDPQSIKLKLAEVKNRLLSEITGFRQQNVDNEYVIKKLDEAQERILSEVLDPIDDETVTRFMLYTKLSAELTSEES